MGHTIADTALRDVLLSLGYSLQMKKNLEGRAHQDRDAQFEHIKQQCKQFDVAGNPIISVDGKNMELLGNFKHNGREWQAKEKKPTSTSLTVFRSPTGKPFRMGSLIWYITRAS